VEKELRARKVQDILERLKKLPLTRQSALLLNFYEELLRDPDMSVREFARRRQMSEATVRYALSICRKHFTPFSAFP
jgi:hypothetical protein